MASPPPAAAAEDEGGGEEEAEGLTAAPTERQKVPNISEKGTSPPCSDPGRPFNQSRIREFRFPWWIGEARRRRGTSI